MVLSLWAFICAALTALSAGSNIQEIFKDTTCDGFAMVTLNEWMNSIAVLPETYITLETYELHSADRYANCKHRWHPTDEDNVFFRHTRCYNIDKKTCQDFKATIKFASDRCGRAQEVPASTGNFVLKFYSTDLNKLMYFSACYTWDTDGDCTLGFVDVNVKESLLSTYDKETIQTTKVMLEQKYNITFSNAEKEFKDQLKECPII